MVTATDLLTAVNERLTAAFPGYTVYTQDCPQDFARPSFLLKHVKTSKLDATRHSVEKTVDFAITCFTPVDDYFRSDGNALSELQDKVLKQFDEGYLKAGDRALKLQAGIGKTETDRSSVELQFKFFDDRFEPTGAEEPRPLMQTINMNYKEI